VPPVPIFRILAELFVSRLVANGAFADQAARAGTKDHFHTLVVTAGGSDFVTLVDAADLGDVVTTVTPHRTANLSRADPEAISFVVDINGGTMMAFADLNIEPRRSGLCGRSCGDGQAADDVFSLCRWGRAGCDGVETVFP